MSKFVSSPENLADIDTLAERLHALSIGETLSYQHLSEAIGRDIRAHRHLLYSAIERVEDDNGILFATVRAHGIKRLSADEIPDVGLASLRKVRRAARSSMERLSRIRTNDMSHADQQRIIAHRSQLGAIALVADGRKTQAVETVIEDGRTVPAGRVLELFRS